MNKATTIDEVYSVLYYYYLIYCNKLTEPDFEVLIDDPQLNQLRPMTDVEFSWAINNNDQFCAKWGVFSNNQALEYLLETEGEAMTDKVRWKHLTQDQAIFVKKLRVSEGHSWRSVARHFVMEYKLEDKPTHLMGVLLCEAARKALNELLEDNWN